MTTDRNHPAPAPAPAPPTPHGRRRSRFRDPSLLLNPVPVLSGTLAAFALAFGGLTMRLASGHDPGVSSAARVAPRGSAATLRTHASGASAASAGARIVAQTGSLVSRASGAVRADTARGD